MISSAGSHSSRTFGSRASLVRRSRLSHICMSAAVTIAVLNGCSFLNRPTPTPAPTSVRNETGSELVARVEGTGGVWDALIHSNRVMELRPPDSVGEVTRVVILTSTACEEIGKFPFGGASDRFVFGSTLAILQGGTSIGDPTSDPGPVAPPTDVCLGRPGPGPTEP
jgi:hypothetical protein